MASTSSSLSFLFFLLSLSSLKSLSVRERHVSHVQHPYPDEQQLLARSPITHCWWALVAVDHSLATTSKHPLSCPFVISGQPGNFWTPFSIHFLVTPSLPGKTRRIFDAFLRTPNLSIQIAAIHGEPTLDRSHTHHTLREKVYLEYVSEGCGIKFGTMI